MSLSHTAVGDSMGSYTNDSEFLHNLKRFSSDSIAHTGIELQLKSSLFNSPFGMADVYKPQEEEGTVHRNFMGEGNFAPILRDLMKKSQRFTIYKVLFLQDNFRGAKLPCYILTF